MWAIMNPEDQLGQRGAASMHRQPSEQPSDDESNVLPYTCLSALGRPKHSLNGESSGQDLGLKKMEARIAGRISSLPTTTEEGKSFSSSPPSSSPPAPISASAPFDSVVLRGRLANISSSRSRQLGGDAASSPLPRHDDCPSEKDSSNIYSSAVPPYCRPPSSSSPLSSDEQYNSEEGSQPCAADYQTTSGALASTTGVARTCVSCRKSKVKCSRSSPCDRCIRLKLVCVAQTRGRGRPVTSNKRPKLEHVGVPGTAVVAAVAEPDPEEEGTDVLRGGQCHTGKGETDVGASDVDRVTKVAAARGISFSHHVVRRGNQIGTTMATVDGAESNGPGSSGLFGLADKAAPSSKNTTSSTHSSEYIGAIPTVSSDSYCDAHHESSSSIPLSVNSFSGLHSRPHGRSTSLTTPPSPSSQHRKSSDPFGPSRTLRMSVSSAGNPASTSSQLIRTCGGISMRRFSPTLHEGSDGGGGGGSNCTDNGILTTKRSSNSSPRQGRKLNSSSDGAGAAAGGGGSGSTGIRGRHEGSSSYHFNSTSASRERMSSHLSTAANSVARHGGVVKPLPVPTSVDNFVTTAVELRADSGMGVGEGVGLRAATNNIFNRNATGGVARGSRGGGGGGGSDGTIQSTGNSLPGCDGNGGGDGVGEGYVSKSEKQKHWPMNAVNQGNPAASIAIAAGPSNSADPVSSKERVSESQGAQTGAYPRKAFADCSGISYGIR